MRESLIQFRAKYNIHLVLIHLIPAGPGSVRMKERIHIVLYPTEPPRICRYYYATVDVDAGRACRVVAKFLADPEATVAASGTHCGICGRALTDPESRVRGIGPECQARWGDFLNWMWMDPAPADTN